MDWFGRIALCLLLPASPTIAAEQGAGSFAFTLSGRAFDDAASRSLPARPCVTAFGLLRHSTSTSTTTVATMSSIR